MEKYTGKYIQVEQGGHQSAVYPIQFHCRKPADAVTGEQRDQTGDAAEHMRYAASLNLPTVDMGEPKEGTAIIVGAAPSVQSRIDQIRALASVPGNAVFALNWTHTWLLKNGIVPNGCVMFEIDAEPKEILEDAHPDVDYYICSHCHQTTFDSLEEQKRILWHSLPNSEAESVVHDEFFKDKTMLGGGVSTFTRTMSLALTLGYRKMELFGVDSSFPDDSSSHIIGYPTTVTTDDAFFVWAKDETTNEVRRFKTVGYLAYQVDEFKRYCQAYHGLFSLKVHGDGLLPWVHRQMWAHQYVDEVA